MKISADLPETFSADAIGNWSVVVNWIFFPVVFDGRKCVYPHKNAEAEVSLQLLGGDRIQFVIFFSSHYFFCI